MKPQCLTVAMLLSTPLLAADGGATAPSAAATTVAPGEKRTVEMKNAKGTSIGTVTVEETPHGLLLTASLKGLKAGDHAIHIHQTGKCDAPDFKSAGGHFNPTHKMHGMRTKEGEHGGDLPNFTVAKGGTAHVEMFAPDLTLATGPNAVQDEDGAAIVVHAQADDYASQPAGNAGDRVACGVIPK